MLADGIRGLNNKRAGELWGLAKAAIGQNQSAEDYYRWTITYIEMNDELGDFANTRNDDNSEGEDDIDDIDDQLTDDDEPDLTDTLRNLEDELDDDLPRSSDAEREDILRQVLVESGVEDETLLDDLGRVMDREKLVEIAQIGGIWEHLSAEQRQLFLENRGVLSSGKAYTSRRIKTELAPNVRKTMVQLADGSRVLV